MTSHGGEEHIQTPKLIAGALEAATGGDEEGMMLPLSIPTERARVKGEMCWAEPVTQKATGEVGPDVKQKLAVLLWPAGACPGGNDPA